MVSIVKILKSVDLISPNIAFEFKGQNKLKSCSGGILSILLFFIFSLAFIFFGRDSLLKERPLTSFSTKKEEKAKIMLEDLPIVFHPTTISGYSLLKDENFIKGFEMRAEIWQFNLEEGFMNTLLVPIVKCTGEYANKLANIVSLGLLEGGAGACFDYSAVLPYKNTKEETKPYIQNPLIDNYSSFISFNIAKCNEEKSPGCRKYTEKVPEFSLWIYSVRSNVNADNFEQPVLNSKFTTDVPWSGNLNIRKNITFTKNQSVTDQGLMFESLKTEEFNTVSFVDDSMTEYNDQTRSIVTVNLQVDSFKGIYFRKYLKLQEVLASVGGILKIFTVLFQIVAGMVSRHSLYATIALKQSSQTVKINNLFPDKDLSSTKKQIVSTKTKKTGNLSLISFVLANLGLNLSSKRKIKEVFREIDIEHISERLKTIEQITKDNA